MCVALPYVSTFLRPINFDRDVTPRNVFVSARGVIKLANFEAARAFVPPVRTFSHEVTN